MSQIEKCKDINNTTNTNDINTETNENNNSYLKLNLNYNSNNSNNSNNSKANNNKSKKQSTDSKDVVVTNTIINAKNNNYNNSNHHNNNNNYIDNLNEEYVHNLEALEEESYPAIIWHLIKLAIPLVLTFISLSLLATFMFYLLRESPLYVTEGFSLLLLYFNCFIVGIFWGSSFGLQILGADAYGKNKNKKVNEYLHQSIFCTFVLSIAVTLFSVFVVPKILTLLSPDPKALAVFTVLIKSFSFCIPCFAMFQSFLRLANIFQSTNVCFLSTVMGCVLQGLVAYFLFTYLDLGVTSIGIGYISNFLYCLVFFLIYFYYFNNPDDRLTKFSLDNIHYKGIFKQIKYAAFPMLNYLMFLMSCEFVSFFGFVIDDIHFTVLTVYMNILSVIVVISEAISASMSSCISFELAKRNYSTVNKIFNASFLISVLVQILLIGGILIFPNNVLSVFSVDPNFIAVANDNIRLFCVAISLNSFHFIFCEYIICCGNHSLPFYSLLVGKYIIQFGGCLILTPLFGFSGIISSMIIGQIACILIFVYYMRYHIDFETDNELMLDYTSSPNQMEVGLLENEMKSQQI